MGLVLVTPPADYPVTIQEARVQCGVHEDDTTYDDQLNGYIASATSLLDGPNGLLGQAIMPQTWDYYLDAFTDTIELPLGPVTAVTSVKYYDADGVQQTASTDDYTVDLASYRQWVVLNSASSWPTTLSAINAVSVRFTAAMSETDLPAVKQAILAQVDHWFQPIGPNNDANQFERMFNAIIGPKRRVFV